MLATGWANLEPGEPLTPGHRFPAPGVTMLVTATAVLRLVADGRIGLDSPANDRQRTVRLADDTITVRELLSHPRRGGQPRLGNMYADIVPELPELFPARPADIGPGAVSGYNLTMDGVFQPVPARIPALQAAAQAHATLALAASGAEADVRRQAAGSTMVS